VNVSLAIEVASELCKRFEGCYLKPYLCPAGVPTIGYGATYYMTGESVRMTDAPITNEQAKSLLLWMIETRYLPAVIKLCPEIDTPERLAAIIDFTFNLGSGALKVSTLRRKINSGNWHDVPSQLSRWNKAGGRVLRGLTNRRAAEAAFI